MRRHPAALAPAPVCPAASPLSPFSHTGSQEGGGCEGPECSGGGSLDDHVADSVPAMAERARPASLTAAPRAAGPAAENVRIAAAREPPAARRFSGAPNAAARLLGAAQGQGSGLEEAANQITGPRFLPYRACPRLFRYPSRCRTRRSPSAAAVAAAAVFRLRHWKEQMGTLSMRLARPAPAPAPPPPLSCAAVRTEHAQPRCCPRQALRPSPLISRVPAGVDVLCIRSFGLLPLTLLDEGRKEREGRGFLLPLHVVQPRELIFVSNAAYVTRVFLRTCLAHPFNPCNNP